ncbi:hypothetical protein H6501_00395 [Candidatus Woesearchaeota archaeon]|nr:hypothetical protein [Nanoarchaeota archaeon]MCB9370038.1 hypothetical protein [Candidatus Woesearchaeota archaeon]USN44570.1 MAG: hypothetical protein H6500_01865 [Candidatus Woesearchaeota archaeon]
MKKNSQSITTLLIIAFTLALVFFASFFGSEVDRQNTLEQNSTTLTIPIIGTQLDFKDTSLFVSSIVIGLLDGFNPCAMWVLIYLITMVTQLGDKRKMWFIVGTFLLTSGIIYFIILTTWIGAWHGFEKVAGAFASKWMIYIIGAFAVFSGAYALNDFVKSGGQITCEVGDKEKRKETMGKIKKIALGPLTIASVVAVIILAFVINSVEFFCSVALPALFTSLLVFSDISLLSQYFYIFLYTLAFMADDIIVFSLALFAINSPLVEKYSGLSKVLGGAIMLLLGIVLLFHPQWFL